MNILFVCTGNICRSPLAEGILRSKFAQYKVDGNIDSAGFEEFHAGDPPDPRAIRIAKEYNIDITGHRARLVKPGDFSRFDRIYAMDAWHYQRLIQMARSEEERKKVNFVMNEVYPGRNIPVKDPYYEGSLAFSKVFLQLDEACDKIARDAAREQSPSR